MNNVNFTINGIKTTAPADQTILDAALKNGIYIPHLCYHPDLKPDHSAIPVKVGHLSVEERTENYEEVDFGLNHKEGVIEGDRCHNCDTQCRLCLVEVDDKGVTTSCNTPVREGMEIRTDTPKIEEFRRVCMESILSNHIGDCLTCFKNTQCKLQDAANYLGGMENGFQIARETEPRFEIDDSNPFYAYDANKCILCGNCVFTCTKIQGVSAIDFAFWPNGRVGKSVADSRCESCGECVERCPVGALAPKKDTRPSREVPTVCCYCGVGCGILLGIRGQRVVGVRANRKSPVNKGNLCVKGRYGWEFINHPDRLRKPLVRKENEFVEVEWEEALDLVAEKLGRYKGEAFAAFSSARASIEDNYVFQKFTRAVMGTNNIDHCARL